MNEELLKTLDKEAFDWLNGNLLSYTIWNNKYRKNNEPFQTWLERVSNGDARIIELILQKKFLFAGRTLSNRNTPDGSYSNCYSAGYVEDSLEDILKVNTQLALTYKAQGGQGVSLSHLRPKGTSIKGLYKSDGIIPFMEIYNTTTTSIMQGGSRKGALLISLDVWHKEAEAFISIKSSQGKIEKANLSLEIDDEFMSYVDLYYKTGEEKTINITRSYNNNSITYEVIPIKLFKYLCLHAREFAEPGILFTNKFRNYNIMEYCDNYKIETANPCQPGWATILTPSGIKTLNHINIGDIIWSSEGWTTVLHKICTGKKQVYQFKTTSGSFIGTDNHRIISKGKKIEVKDAKSIDGLVGEYSHSSKLDSQDVMDGLVLGDGSVSNDNLIYLCIGENDKDYFKSNIKSLITKHRPGIKKYAYEIITTLKTNEVPLTHLRKVPDRFFYGNSSKVKGFLRGLYSANGSIVANRVTLKTASPILRDQVQIMLSSIGISSYYTTNKSKKVLFKSGVYTCKESYDINISTDKGKFYFDIGFIQDYKMEKLADKITETVLLKKSKKITQCIPLKTESVYSITVDNFSHTYWTGGLNVANCGEQCLPKHGACNLSSINLSEYIINPFTNEAILNYDQLGIDVSTIVKAMDDVLEENLNRHALPEQKQMAQDYRNIGIGIMGLADMFVKLGINYNSQDACMLAENTMKFIFRKALYASSDLAVERGNFPKYDPKVWDSTIIQNAFTEEEIFELIEKNMLRNCSLLSIAPTGSIGTMFNISTGVEPFFQIKYTRRTESLNAKETSYEVYTQTAQDYKKITKEETLPNYFISSEDIYWENRINMQASLQKYVDTAISSTINLPKDTSVEIIGQIYLKAWHSGLKGITVYREGSRNAILSKIGSKPLSLENRKAPKRPDKLEAHFYPIKAKGENFIVLVGLYEGKPYEIFAFRPLHPISISTHKGILTKVKKMHYSFDSEHIQLSNLELANTNVEEKAATLYTSHLLRHGVDIKYIIKTAKKVNDNISSFSSAMCRVLSKYIVAEEIIGEVCPDCGEKLIKEEGCTHCVVCPYSKCG